MTEQEREDLSKVVEGLANACADEATTAHQWREKFSAELKTISDAQTRLAQSVESLVKDSAEQRKVDREQQAEKDRLLLEKVGDIGAQVTQKFQIVESLNQDLTTHLRMPHATVARAR